MPFPPPPQENITECEIQVDPKYHRHFVARRGQVLREIADEYGDVTVSFPRNGSKSDRVVVKGAKKCVEGATARIAEIVVDLVSYRDTVWLLVNNNNNNNTEDL